MASAPADVPIAQPSSCSSPAAGACAAPSSRFSNLRSVRWRMDLGILPSSSDASVEDIRRVAADSRRRYASLRRRLLIDPHMYKDGDRSPGLVMDNPLSQSPDSMWGRFFQNAELEKMVDQDLSRLYPEHGSYFQTPACQSMLRRILLLWCLRHPEYGYRQGKYSLFEKLMTSLTFLFLCNFTGMHELVAPLLYALQVDVQCLCQVRKLHVDQFSDEFDADAFPECAVVSNYGTINRVSWDGENEETFEGDIDKISSLDELEPETRDIILLGDAYGAEGELGMVLSERFMEHDAYCMLDALMNGTRGGVAIADFFSPSPASGSRTSLTPVIEASSAMYHLLSIVDSSLYSHLVELEIEPQYFTLRWLRVLFGREFLLQDLLVLWDEIFSHSNSMSSLGKGNEAHFNFRILCSPRGAFICSVAVSMILHLRSSLLASENATSCLQRLLNFPENINMKALIEKAKSLKGLAVDANISDHVGAVCHGNKSRHIRSYSLSSGSVSPENPLYALPEHSYWEEKWRVLHGTEELQKERQTDPITKRIFKKTFIIGRFSLSRTGPEPSAAKVVGAKEDDHMASKHELLDDLIQEDDSVIDNVKFRCETISGLSGRMDSVSMETVLEKDFSEASSAQTTLPKNFDCLEKERCFMGETFSVFPTATISPGRAYNHENDSEKSSFTSNSCNAENDYEDNPTVSSCNSSINLALRDSDNNPAAVINHGSDADVKEKQSHVAKEKKQLFGKFQWFWKFGKGVSEGNMEKGHAETCRSTVTGNIQKDTKKDTLDASSASSGSTSEPAVGDKKAIDTLRNLGQSMLENIQVLETAFQQEQGEADSLEDLTDTVVVGEGELTATVSALKELRRISNLLSEM
ncbi:hypothetical protein Taro_021703 [Colocasia esculenta]|uniref:Rab-GAP TBC domain-containing protein n=1 Tax=Colocasia esculenta TaxID=4460 RepID=A0A843V378_COLES|nr:hypothetical protein [Colocasia esculenta]